MRIKHLLFSTLAAATIAWAPAAHAITYTNTNIALGTNTALDAAHGGGTIDFLTTQFIPGVLISAKFDHFFNFSTNPSKTANFVDSYKFTIPSAFFNDGKGSGSIQTSATATLSLAFLDFTSVTINNGFNDFVVTTNEGPGQTGSITDIPIFAGVTNTITVTGVAHGLASYGGSATFVPTASVPEASTWAMMLIGFGGIGGSMRYKRRKLVAANAPRTVAFA